MYRTIRKICLAAILGLVFSMALEMGLHTDVFTPPGISGPVPEASAAAPPDKSTALPENPDPGQIDAMMAQLSDEQVRRLLIAEFRKNAAGSAASGDSGETAGKLAGFIVGVGEKVASVRNRLARLRAGKAVELELPDSLKGLADGTRVQSWRRFSILISAVMAAGFAAHLIWLWCVAGLRKRIAATPSDAPGSIKIWHLLLRALLDSVSIVLFAGVVLTVYFAFSRDTGSGRLFVLAYLTAIVLVGGVRLVSRFVLVPGAPGLRLLALGDETAIYLHRRVVWITSAGAFGWLTCGLLRLHRTSEWLYLEMVALTGLVIALMIIGMVWRNRHRVAAILGDALAQDRSKIQWVENWHRIAIVYLVVLWGAWTLLLLLVGAQAVIPVIGVVLSIPAFFIFDRVLQGALNLVFSAAAAERPAALSSAPEPEATDAAAVASSETVAEKSEGADRLQRAIRRSLRVILGALICFWLLELWGISLPVGKALARTAFSIVVTLMLATIAWELVRAPIERKLREEMPEDDEEMEEGGSGGSRIGTLLLLLRKFILTVLVVMVTLIVLSAMGIDIGPLIAGAGVVGLAIGFGAQTLVKDIISGLFFLIDDAFRVGDYIDTGAVKGMVEKISLRSMQMRHPRGMVHTIPFGDIGSVTNFSRDYIITKLDFRVRYDTDVEQVRKIIKKKVYQEIMKDAELAPKLLGKIKSQGVREMDDSAMIMRVKFKSIPGEQFMLRREVFRRMQEAFREAGIQFAHRNVTVYLPPEADDAVTESKRIKQAGGAAAAAAVQAEAEAAQVGTGKS